MILALVLAAAVPPAPPTPATRAAGNEIVVRGRSLAALRADLDRCVARACPLRQDVVAAVRVGEALFRQGRYADSSRLLQDAVRRDRARAADDPLAMAALYEATVTVATHEGDQRVAGHAAGDRARLLGATQGADSYDALRAELDYLDFRSGRQPAAASDTAYARLGERAAAAGQPVVAALATLRRANLVAAYGERATADRLLAPLAAGQAGLPPVIRLEALSMQAHWARKGDKAAAVAALGRAVAATPQPTPVLLTAPPNPIATDAADINYFNLIDRESRAEILGIRWVDIGFAIRPDGTVETPEPLRGTMADGDVRQIGKVMRARRYSPFAAGDGAVYRVERWTLTADYGQLSGSLIRGRGFAPHFVSLDITADPEAPPPAASGGAPATEAG